MTSAYTRKSVVLRKDCRCHNEGKLGHEMSKKVSLGELSIAYAKKCEDYFCFFGKAGQISAATA